MDRGVRDTVLRCRQNDGELKSSSVNKNGCFDNDRIIKSGYVEKRTAKTKKWKTIYIVLRPNTLSMYKNDKEDKLRHQIHLSDLTAVAFLKDPKHKRENVFGLFSPSKNFHLQAPTSKDAQEWVGLIRKDARIEEEEGSYIASSLARSLSSNRLPSFDLLGRSLAGHDSDRIYSSSPENNDPPVPTLNRTSRRESSNMDWSGMSGNELPFLSDGSGHEGAHRIRNALNESPTGYPPVDTGSLPRGTPLGDHSSSQLATLHNAGNVERDLDRVIWQGRLWMLRSKRGVRQWKNLWGVLRARNFILYKDASEYTAEWIVQVSAVVEVVELDPVSRRKENCLQIITEEKSYRFCARDEESLVQFIGAFKSLLARRRGQEARTAAVS
ncbi:hypothetical protein RJ55_07633 [Drechmeria coniospora]|nr:hypothetical protein RJ55_07633 [Drechmeria coniospora]